MLVLDVTNVEITRVVSFILITVGFSISLVLLFVPFYRNKSINAEWLCRVINLTEGLWEEGVLYVKEAGRDRVELEIHSDIYGINCLLKRKSINSYESDSGMIKATISTKGVIVRYSFLSTEINRHVQIEVKTHERYKIQTKE